MRCAPIQKRRTESKQSKQSKRSNTGTNNSTTDECHDKSLDDRSNIIEKENDFALFESEITGSLEVTMVGKGRIELNVSDELSLIISLEPINTLTSPIPSISAVSNTLKTFSKNFSSISGESRTINRNNCADDIMDVESQEAIDNKEDNNNCNDNKDNNNDDKNDQNDNNANKRSNKLDWLSNMFSCSILSAQLLLLNHWKKSLDLFQESVLHEQKIQNAITAKNNMKNNTLMSIKTEDIRIKKEKDEKEKEMSSVSPIGTSTEPIESSKESKEHSRETKDSKKRTSETHSETLEGVDVSGRLVHPMLRARLRDVGDGMAAHPSGESSELNKIYFDLF